MKITELNENEAKEYFLRSKIYCTLELPKYIDFTKVLRECENLLLTKKLDEKIKKVGKYENVNFKIYADKGSNYQWRCFQIIHPILYVNLINVMTKKENWKKLVQCLSQNDDKIKCCSIPICDEENNKSKTILNWWNLFEQEIVANCLDYSYMGITDISNCYSSIYTHSLAWAIEEKEIAKKNKKDKLLGNQIDKLICGMNYGQTNGIPEGSGAMDFIAEILLAYGDRRIVEELNIKNIENYQILRYRDDYRIFSNNRNEVDVIMKTISDVLLDLNLKLNPLKTKVVDNILEYSLKPDKYEGITTGKLVHENLEKHLFQIWAWNRKFPNSGTVVKMMNDVYDRMLIDTNISLFYKQYLSIIVEIMYDSPRVFNTATALISLILDILSEKEKKNIVSKILNKFKNKVSTEYLEIWMQRIELCISSLTVEYKNKLSQLIANKIDSIWDNTWLGEKIECSIINQETLKDLEMKMSKDEIVLDNDLY